MEHVMLWRLNDEYGQQRDRWYPTQREALAAACLRYDAHPDMMVKVNEGSFRWSRNNKHPELIVRAFGLYLNPANVCLLINLTINGYNEKGV
jgi:hypothetical protein